MKFLNKIYQITNIDVESLFKEFTDFYDNDFSKLTQYYINYNIEYPKEAFDRYKNILNRLNILISKLNIHKNIFNNIGYWEILDKIDEIKYKLEEIESYPKFYKVNFLKSKDLNKNQNNIETYVSKQNETLEQVATRFNENWEDLAILNSFKEEDYTNQGGKKIILKSSISSSIKDVEAPDSIIDVLIGKNLLGKDLPNYFEFDSENNDLKNNSPEQTFKETVNRLFSLKKGSIPEFMDLGVSKDILSEATKGEEYFIPILLRQISESLSLDDTILSFEITNIKKEGDSYFIEASVQNRLLETLEFSSELNNE